jgi:hypothetical protein
MTDKEPTNTRPTRFAGKLNHFEKKQTLATVKEEPVEIAVKAPKSPPISTNKPNTSKPIAKTQTKQGKRNNTEYQQISAYLKKDTYIALKKAVFDTSEDMSEVLESLVSKWLKNK